MNFAPGDSEQAEDFRSLKSSPHRPISLSFTTLFKTYALVDRRAARKKQENSDEANRIDFNHFSAIFEKDARKVLEYTCVSLNDGKLM